ncbi:MAG: hypothetical protein IIB38_08670, partial [Candidatus Hydrogenedentes bacterium]|nr:hypothetical protein [Candidatus Hydrogenedentota bacterium]
KSAFCAPRADGGEAAAGHGDGLGDLAVGSVLDDDGGPDRGVGRQRAVQTGAFAVGPPCDFKVPRLLRRVSGKIRGFPRQGGSDEDNQDGGYRHPPTSMFDGNIYTEYSRKCRQAMYGYSIGPEGPK